MPTDRRKSFEGLPENATRKLLQKRSAASQIDVPAQFFTQSEPVAGKGHAVGVAVLYEPPAAPSLFPYKSWLVVAQSRARRLVKPVVPPRFSVNDRDNETVVGAIAPHLKPVPPTCRWLKDNRTVRPT